MTRMEKLAQKNKTQRVGFVITLFRLFIVVNVILIVCQFMLSL